MKTFAADPERPLRPSQLSKLIGCPLSQVLKVLDEQDESSGEAADTGSAVHKAAHAYHKGAKGNLRVALGVMKELLPEYPLADLDRAEELFRFYAGDPRNAQAEVIACEEEVRFSLDPCETDPTQEKIWVKGTLDQIRVVNGMLYLVDLKTGRWHTGPQMVDHHALQLAAYQYGASLKLGRQVSFAQILRTEDYYPITRGVNKGQSRPVFHDAPWRFKDVPVLLDVVRREVAKIRRGVYSPIPGESCRFCPLVSVAHCTRRLEEINLDRT